MGGTAVDSSFWLGAVVGAIFGVFAQFLVRPVERLLDRRLETRTTKRSLRLRTEVAQDPQRLRDFLILQILETTLVGALAASGTAVYFGVIALIGFTDPLSAAGQIIPLLGAVIIIRIASDAISVARFIRKTPSTLQTSRTD